MSGQRNGLVVASNRGPVSWSRADTGELEPSRGFGGLVTALGGALQQELGTWVSVAMDEADQAVASEHDGPFEVEAGGSTFRLRLLDAGDRFEPYYNEVSNRLLWFTLHGLWNPAYTPAGDAWSGLWYGGYGPVNDQVADAVVEAAEAGADELYLQDYHLCLAPRRVRETLTRARVLHYLHTPWAEPEDLRRLPEPIIDELLRGLLGAHVVAFSAPAWAAAFRRCAERLLDARIDGETVQLDDHSTLVTDFTLGVDEADLSSSAVSDAAQAAGRDLDAELADRRLLVRVDRTDLSKNILRGLRAYELLLERHPEHRGRIWHYAHLNPSRQGVEEYERYLEACMETAERIRERFGETSLTVFVGDDYPRAIAALQRFDVLFANPVRDGTNLVAKEGPALNTRDGALVLSHQAGAATQLRDAALMVNPYDVEQQVEALHTALRMEPAERKRRAERLREAAHVGAPDEWFNEQRQTLRAVTV